MKVFRSALLTAGTVASSALLAVVAGQLALIATRFLFSDELAGLIRVVTVGMSNLIALPFVSLLCSGIDSTFQVDPGMTHRRSPGFAALSILAVFGFGIACVDTSWTVKALSVVYLCGWLYCFSRTYRWHVRRQERTRTTVSRDNAGSNCERRLNLW